MDLVYVYSLCSSPSSILCWSFELHKRFINAVIVTSRLISTHLTI